MHKVLGFFIAIVLAAILPASAFSQGTASTLDEIYDAQKNTTNLHYDSHFGTQVEYLSSRGKAYLWFPGNSRIVKGEWIVLSETDNASSPLLMCFNYGENSYNPVTGQRGGWECQALPDYLDDLKEQTSGDMFGLARRSRVPFVLNTVPTTLQQLKDSM
ncbi:MAG: hypothetical protein KDJ19_12215 [Hyphomicrobiaceae bacterium]|nr:hypothetical protein [Hyphomicrobiaceae bacterium]MCC0024310.1 hypothetical protein [Hyphomicrobiaceae bacterium]